MSFPRYESYRNSGVEWLGDVPAHWVLTKIKYVAAFCGGGTPDRSRPDYWDGDIPWVSPKDMKSEIISGAEECITESGLEESTSSLVPANNVLMVVRSGILKHTIPVAINEIPVSLNQDIKALLFRKTECLPSYFLRWVQGLNDQLLFAWSKQGATVESIEHLYLAETLLPLPGFEEQIAIANFLDFETAKIDDLVEEQRRLIQLLKEKRQTIISHVVTKGLSPDVPMKDSGVEWLGKVPAHWEIDKLTRSFVASKGKRGQLLTKEYCADHEGEYPVYSGQTENDGVMGWIGDYEYDTRSDGVLFSTTVGAKAMTLRLLRGKFSLSQNCMVMAPKRTGVDVRFVYFHLQPLFRYERNIIPDHMQASFRVDDLYRYYFALPPLPEQQQIARFLDAELAKFDSLMQEAGAAIELLQERRSALISAAVTGKIDVRGLVPGQAEAA